MSVDAAGKTFVLSEGLIQLFSVISSSSSIKGKPDALTRFFRDVLRVADCLVKTEKERYAGASVWVGILHAGRASRPIKR